MRLRSRLKQLIKALIKPKVSRAEWICSWAYSYTLACPDGPRFRQALRRARRYCKLGGWALTANSLKAFVGALHGRRNPAIIEFGSGVSTVLLGAYFKEEEARIDSFEHQKLFVEKLRPHLHGTDVRLHEVEAWQFTDGELTRILQGLVGLADMYRLGNQLDKKLYAETRVRNVFYRLEAADLAGRYDGMILDGPNGNGRSIAFAALRDRMAEPGYILIDDCNHYDFVYECSHFFRFNILCAEVYPYKRWALLEVRRA